MRIQTQAESFAYRVASEPQKLYRGVRVNLPPELEDEMREKLADPRTREEAGRELDLGPKILHHLATTPWETSIGSALHDRTGVGPHWHDDPGFAHTAAYGDLDEAQQGQLKKRSWPLLMVADHPGPEHVVPSYGGDSIENETQLRQGTPLNITSLLLQPELDFSSGKRGVKGRELLHNPMYERYGIHPGGPVQVTA